MGKPNFDALVQELVNAAVKEGEAAATFTKPMKPYYDATHAARDALMDAIDKATRGVALPREPEPKGGA